MAKIKLMSFEIISLLGDSKKIVDYLQKTGAVQFEDATDEELIKYKTTAIVSQLENKLALAKNAYTILEENCKLKKSPSAWALRSAEERGPGLTSERYARSIFAAFKRKMGR